MGSAPGSTPTRAAVLREVGRPLVVEELELLPPRAGEVLVRFVASGVCHSDLHVMQGHMLHPLPVVLGHEGAGLVEALGPGVSGVRVGDHVLTSYIPSCGRCPYCATGRPNLCDLRDAPRHLMPDGTTRFRRGDEAVNHFLQVSSYSARAVLPEASVIPVRRDAPLEVVCLVSCGVAAGAGAVVNRARVAPGSSVVVIGCGGVGLNAIQAAALVGAARIVAVDVHDAKLEDAREFGATHVVNTAREADALTRIHELCGRGGADYAIEVVGSAATIELALRAVHRGGTAVVVGIAPVGTRLSVDPALLLQERVLTGSSFGGSRQRVDLPMYVDLFMQGRYKLRELISGEVGLDGLNEAYARLERGEVRRSVLRFE
jgi:S-(hydroxymethyl)glutathione dehydrogenase/alcohol dehydrogenase